MNLQIQDGILARVFIEVFGLKQCQVVTWYQKCADIVKIAGYNYAEKYYDKHHKEHKDWIIYGSETGSIVQSMGIYHFPYSQSVLADDDEQCSALGNSATS